MYKKATRPQAYNVIKKETLTQVFSCEFCESSKNTYFYITPPVVASENKKLYMTTKEGFQFI